MKNDSKVDIYYLTASILVPTIILIAFIASGMDLGNALLYGIVAYGVLPPFVLIIYLLRNKDVSQKKRFRVTMAIAVVTGVMLVICVVSTIVALGSESVSTDLNARDLRIEAPFVDESVPYQDINGLELRNDVDYGSRSSGYAGDHLLSGNFRNDEFGNYKLAVHKATDECIVVHQGGGILVFNLDSSDKTEQFYDDLSSRISET